MGKRFIRWIPPPAVLQRISALHIWVYRRTGGLLGKRLDGLDILLLTTTGRKSGATRVAPLPYFRDGDRVVLIASKGGTDKHPAWYHNLSANPEVTLQIGRTRARGQAVTVQGPERTRIWRKVTKDHPRYDRYLDLTDRRIPVVVITLSPVSADATSAGVEASDVHV
jgi:deazaflavin-dependent oxidoreductase (nitroreductase family)